MSQSQEDNHNLDPVKDIIPQINPQVHLPAIILKFSSLSGYTS